MKTSRSTLLGVALIGGALVLHFSKKKEQTQPTVRKPAPLKITTTLNGEPVPKPYQEAETLVLQSRHLPSTKRQESLRAALSILRSLQRQHPDWNPALLQKRILQTEIALHTGKN